MNTETTELTIGIFTSDAFMGKTEIQKVYYL